MIKGDVEHIKITFVISSLSGGGAERVTCNLANYFFEKGYSVDVVTFSNKNDTYRLSNGIDRFCLLDEADRKGRIHNIRAIRKELKRYVMTHCDVSCYVVMLPISSFLLARLRRHINGRIIVSDRVDPASYGLMNRFFMNYAVKRCDGLVVQTKSISDWYKNVKNRVVIPNAINKDIVLPLHKKTEKKFVAVGRLSRQKNYQMLIRAFEMFSFKYPDYVLEIYGQGGLEQELKSLVKEKGLAGKVKFMGYVKNVSERISNATCFVMSSNYEGMSNALIEAMCIGLPCVVTDCDGGGARELIKNGENGLLVEKGSSEKMAEKMIEVVENDGLRNMMVVNAKKMRDELDSERIYGKWLDFVEKNINM